MKFSQPDPEEIMNRLRKAFNEAARNSSGAARPLFEKARDDFEKTIKIQEEMTRKNPDQQKLLDAIKKKDMSAIMKEAGPLLPDVIAFIKAEVSVGMAFRELSEMAKTDPDVRQAMEPITRELENLKKSQMETLSEMMGDSGSGLKDLLGGFLRGKPSEQGGDSAAPSEDTPSRKPPRPKRPGSGKIKFD